MTTLKTRTLGLAAVAVMFGGIAVSAGLGLWKTESTKQPAAIKSGEFAGMPSPSDIRGSYTWADVASAFGIPEASVVRAFSAGGANEKVNGLEALYAGKLPAGAELGTDSVRLFVALYTGLPHEPEADTVLPLTAIDLLRSEGKAAASLIDAAAARAVAIGGQAVAAEPAQPAQPTQPAAAAPAPAAAPVPAAKPAAVQPAAAPAPTAEHVQTAGAVTGKTTFLDLESWGYDMAKVSGLLGGLGSPSQAVKDYCAAKGLTFSDVKARLEALAP